MRRLLLLFALALLLLGAGIGLLLVPRSGGTAAAFSGAALNGRPAPSFQLRDQFGRTITLSQFRGHPVILTFVQSHCTGQCPLDAEKIYQALRSLGRPAAGVAVLGISADPAHDTPASARAFSRRYGLLHRWHFLLGSRSMLTPVWKQYYVYVAPAGAPAALVAAHTAATFLLDTQGRERALFTGADLTTPALARDLRILLGLPVSAAVLPGAAPQLDHPAPPFSLHTLDGAPLSLSRLRGRPVLLNFWATWCVACRSEMPLLERWSRQHPGVTVLGIDQEEGRTTVQPFLRRLGVTYPIALDSDGRVSGRYDLVGLPASFFLDRQGVIRATRLGTLNVQWLSRALQGATR